MIEKKNPFLVLVIAALLAASGAARAEQVDGVKTDKMPPATAHTGQAIPTESAPTSQSVPTSTSAAAVATPALPQIRMRTIFDFQKELELNDEQVAKLRQAIDEMTAKLKVNQTQLNELATTLTEMIRKDVVDSEVKPLLEKIAVLQIDGQMTDIRTSARINTILTPAQKERWIGIQIGDRAHFTK